MEEFNRLDQESNKSINYVSRAFQTTKKYYIGTIHGQKNETINTAKEFRNFIYNFGGDHRINYAEISVPHTTEFGYHQHFIVMCKDPVRMTKTRFNIGDGKIFNVYYPPQSIYSMRTGDFSRYLVYMRNLNPNKTPYINYDPEHQLKEDGLTFEFNNTKKPSFNDAINMALEMEDQKEAVAYLNSMYAEKMLTAEPKFRQKHRTRWQTHNFNKWIDERAKDYNPWHEEDPALRTIQSWVRNAVNSDTNRSGILFIVGPTKTGKTEYILSEIVRKHPTYYARGEFTFQYFNSDVDYKLYVFDDVPFRTRQDLDTLKSLVSVVGPDTIQNIKYDYKSVPSRPVIVICNEDGMHRIQYLIRNYLYNGPKDTNFNQPTIDWWNENSKIVNINDKIYYTTDEMIDILMEEEEEDENNNDSISETNETVDDESETENDHTNMTEPNQSIIEKEDEKQIEKEEEKAPKPPKSLDELDEDEIRQKFLDKIKKDKHNPYKKSQLMIEYLQEAGVFDEKEDEDVEEIRKKLIKYETKINKLKKQAKKYAFGNSISKILEEEINDDTNDLNLTNQDGVPFMEALDDYEHYPHNHIKEEEEENMNVPERTHTPFMNAPPIQKQFNSLLPKTNQFDINDGDFEFIQD